MSDSSDQDQTIAEINKIASESSSTPAAPASGAGQSDGSLIERMADEIAGGAAAMADGSQAMLADANSGKLVFDPDTGTALMDMLNNHLLTLAERDRDINVITRPTKLGMTAGGQAMSKFNVDVAATGSKAFLPVHKQFGRTLKTMGQAIRIAMDNYARSDEGNADTFKPKD